LDATEKRQVETQLLKMGLAGLQANGDPSTELVGQLAGIVNSHQSYFNRHGEWVDQHKFFSNLLAECDKQYRTEMYEAIRPHLNFKVRSLAEYESMMTERIHRLASKGAAHIEGQAPKPIEVGKKKFAEATREFATHALATVHCQRCWKKKNFLADTPAGAMIAARKAGWARMPVMGVPKETCPACIKKLKALVN
jgi:hypothetical protein